MKASNVSNTPTLMESVGIEPKVMGGSGLGAVVLGIGFATACALGVAVPLAVPVILITVGFSLVFSGFAVNGVQWDGQVQAREDVLRATSKRIEEEMKRLQSGDKTPEECFQELQKLRFKPEGFDWFAKAIGLGDQYNSAYRDFYKGKAMISQE